MTKSVVKQVAELARLDITELRARWCDLFGAEAPGYSRPYIIKRLAYRIQELAYGGLCEESRARLKEVAGEELIARGRGREKARPGAPLIGTRLVREWNGRRYEVTAVSGGYEFEGKRYRSLSAITKTITGTQWNAPSFFGLRDKTGKRAS